MSDVAQGEGWWLATDGRWYPPELHPDAAAGPAPDGAHDRSTAGPEAGRAAVAPDAGAPGTDGPGVPAWSESTPAEVAARPTGPVADGPVADGPAPDGAAPDGPAPDVAAPDGPGGDDPAASAQAASSGPGDGSGSWVTVDVPAPRRGPAHARGARPPADEPAAGPASGGGPDESTDAAIRGLLVLLGLAVVAALLVWLIGSLTSGSSSSTPTTASTTTSVVRATTTSTTAVPRSLPQDPHQALSTTVSAATAEGSVHLNGSYSAAGHPTDLDMDVARDGATGRLIAQGGEVQMIVISQTIYLQGSSQYLESLGLTPAQAAHYAGTWISAPASTRALEPLGALNFANVVDGYIDLVPPLSLSPPAPQATPEALLHGTVPTTSLTAAGYGSGSPATLTVSATSPFLPVRTAFTGATVGSATYTYSLWGENVVLEAPANAVPLAQAEGH
jgi:hypothetical protein